MPKILRSFNSWITDLRIPAYTKVAKIIPLSKDENNSPFPKLGDVRTIAVAPAITKLFELCILQKLRAEIADKSLIHTNQRGFVLEKSCEDNIVDLLQIMNTAKDLEQAYRVANIRNHQREKTYLVFIDLKKAFDKVPRRRLIQKMTDMNIKT